MEDLNLKTPYYIFDITAVKDKAQWIRKQLGERIQLCFSVKANPWIIPYIIDDFDYLEVCSIGELVKCLEYNIPEQKIIWGGVVKTKEDIEYVSGLNLKFVSVESIIQLQNLQHEKQRIGGKQDILLRVTSGNQFGLDEVQISDILRQKKSWSNLNFFGIHYYSGTQKPRSDIIIKELGYLEELNKRLGLKKLEYGPGIMVPYYTSEEPLKDEILLEEISGKIRQVSRMYDVGIEMGRLIAARSGKIYTQIVDIKENAGRKYYILDSGRNHFVYPNLGFGIKTPEFTVHHRKCREREKENVIVCGPLCTSSDIIMKNVLLDACDVGDLFVFENLGAYSSTESISLFLQHEYPAVYIKNEGRLIKVQDKKYLL